MLCHRLIIQVNILIAICALGNITKHCRACDKLDVHLGSMWPENAIGDDARR